MKTLKLMIATLFVSAMIFSCSSDSYEDVADSKQKAEMENIKVKKEENGTDPTMPPKM